jgi:hypothetical protein
MNNSIVDKELQQAQTNLIVANYDLGKSLYNRAENKLVEAKKIFQDKSGMYEKLNEECNGLFRQSIPFFKDAIRLIDNMDDEGKVANCTNLRNCLDSLHTVYTHLEMYEELKPIKHRIDELL